MVTGTSPRSIEITRHRLVPIVALGGAPFTDVLSVTLDDRAANRHPGAPPRHRWAIATSPWSRCH